MAMDVVDYEIKGAEMRFLRSSSIPARRPSARRAALTHMDGGISMDTVFGDGSAQGGLLGKLLGAGKRLVTGGRCSRPFTPTRRSASSSVAAPRPIRARSSRWTCASSAAR